VIHAMSGEQDLRKMGGLKAKLPWTHLTMLIGCVAIAGIPPLAGFFSKDEILWSAFRISGYGTLVWVIGFVAAGMTAFYMFRALFMTFWGTCRADEHVKHHIHESPRVMTVPLTVLAVLSVVGGYVGVPHVLGGSNAFHEFLMPVIGGPAPAKAHAGLSLVAQAWASGGEAGSHGGAALEIGLMALSVSIALAGIGMAWLFYVKNPALPALLAKRWSGLYRAVSNKYYVDELYEALFVTSLKRLGTGLWRGFDEFVIDGTVNGIACFFGWISGVLRQVQTGYVQNYAFAIVLGGVFVAGYYLMRAIFF
jgi:NADH-quinone oxidoreductase subunit L